MDKILVAITGVPGSGKSTLAEKLAKENNGIVLTTDDFFMKGDEYHFNGSFIRAAHDWNFGRFAKAVFDGVSYIVVPNTNLEAWQLFRYVELAAQQGYDFKIAEPKTKWANDPVECAKRNVHGVPEAKIREMLAKKQPLKDMEKELRAKFYK